MPVQKLLLICGALAAGLYIATDVVAAGWFYPGYDYTAQQVSELSAIGAPSRPFWMAMGYPYAVLTIVFAIGVWRTGIASGRLRIAAVLILLFAVNGFAWGLVAPMHMRATEFTDSDRMHIAFAASTVALIALFIGFGAAALSRNFRIFSAVIVVAMLAAGGIVSTQVSAIAAGRPTPWMGLVERVSVYGPMLWMAAFAVALLGREAWRDGSRAAA